VPPQHFEYRFGRRPLRQQNADGADRERKGHGIAHAIGEEQLGGGEHHVVLANADDMPAHQSRRCKGRGVSVLDALRLAGRAGCVEPERDFVGKRRRREHVVAAARHKLGEIVHVAAGSSKSGAVIGATADKYYAAQPRQPIEDWLQRFGQRRRSDDRRSAAVAEDIGVLLGSEQRIERQRHDAGAHAAPERHRKIDRVVEQKRKPFLRPQPDIEKRGSELAAAHLQGSVGQRPIGVDEGGFAGEPTLDRRIDEISDGVVRPPLQQVFQHERSPPDAARVSPFHNRVRAYASLMRCAPWRNARSLSKASKLPCQPERFGGNS
jgi:hypothetical protein